MCDNDWTEELRSDFDAACKVFGWTKRTKEYSQGDEENMWFENTWLNAMGDYLFSEDKIVTGFVRELIRIGKSNQTVLTGTVFFPGETLARDLGGEA